MIPGITAQDAASSGPNPPSAEPFAVQFNSAKLILASLACIDNQFFGFAGWFKNDWTTFGVPWVVDPDNNYNSNLSPGGGANIAFTVAGSSGSFKTLTAHNSSPVIDTGWHHVIGAAKTNLGAGSKIIKLKIDGVDRTGSVNDTNTSFSSTSDGLPFFVGTDDQGPSNFYQGSMCDLSIWVGLDLMTGSSDISATTIGYFIDGSGHWVAPSVAVAALGHPPIFLTGPAASFAANSLGTSGAFTIASGSLTDNPNPPT